jgi:hypothetical protein
MMFAAASVMLCVLSACAAPSPAEQLKALLASLPDTTEYGFIRGIVWKPDRTPFPGVTVFSTPTENRTGSAVVSASLPHSDAPGPANESAVLDTALEHARWRAATASCITGADGTYELRLDASRWHRIEAFLDGWCFDKEIRSGGLWHQGCVKCGSVVDFGSRPLITVSVDVRLPGGGQPRQAVLEVSHYVYPYDHSTSSRRFGWTPLAPTIFLAPDEYFISASASEHEDAFISNAAVLMVRESAPLASVALQMRARGILKFTVHAPWVPTSGYLTAPIVFVREGQSESAEAALRGYHYDSDARKHVLQTCRTVQDRKETAGGRAAGTRVFEDMDFAPGVYRLGIAWNGELLQSEEVSVQPGTTRIEWHLRPLPRDRFVVIHAHTPTGLSVPGLRVTKIKSVDPAGLQPIWPSEPCVIHLPDDSLSVLFPTYVTSALQPAEPAGEWELGLASTSNGGASCRFTRRAMSEAEARFFGVCWADVTLNGFVKPATRMYARLTLVATSGPLVFTDGVGHTTSGGPVTTASVKPGPVVPGQYYVRLEYWDDATGFSNSMCLGAVDLVEGRQALAFDLPTLSDLTISAPDAPEGARVSIASPKTDEQQPEHWARGSSTLRRDHTMTFRWLPPGKYAVKWTVLEKPGVVAASGEATVTIPGPATVEVPRKP